MKKNKNLIIDVELMECPRCKENTIRAHSVRNCYYDYLYCPKCGQVQIEVHQDKISRHSLYATEVENIIQTTTYSFSDGKEIQLQEVIYEKNTESV